MIRSLLIANRGEIACRVIRTARRLGIRTVAVYSDADRDALHVRQADEAVHIGPSPAAQSYLVGEKIIAAAKATGAEAIHPGYGFLSENAAFAQAVIDAGLVWVGPRPESISAMGLKDAAKALMQAAGVPVTPGYLGEDQSPERLEAEAGQIGYPVLIKAVAGGGGKGMRQVDAPDDFADALASCRREARASFGNDQVLIEKLIANPRHIEVQVFGDGDGNVVHLFERDCSLQRRHQKVIEEAPAPGMDQATRSAICDAAVRAARAVGYIGAGTVEFIADASEGLRADRIWFMEMNTRLQVEHPVTEAITGVDLVEWQLRVASGEPLPMRQDDLAIHGHAIEARLYAEDPANGFLPSIGQLEAFDLGESWSGSNATFRFEKGVEEGDAISPHYDPMIAKVIAHASERDAAIYELSSSLNLVEIWPVRSNAPFLWRALDNDDFKAGRITTAFIETHFDSLISSTTAEDRHWNMAARAILNPKDGEPEQMARGFRLNADACERVTLYHQGECRTIQGAEIDRETFVFSLRDSDSVVVFEDGAYFEFQRNCRGAGHQSVQDGAILAPMPGRVIALDVAQGDRVAKGQRLMVLEAMKMEHALAAPYDGVVSGLNVTLGAQVQVDALLASIGKAED